VIGTAGNDTLNTYGVTGEKITIFEVGGQDIIYCGNAVETVIGGPGNDTIYARAASEGAGKKIFVWNPGDGNDTIRYDNPARVAGDELAILRFGPGVLPGHVITYTSGTNHIIEISPQSGGSGKITFISANNGEIRYQMDRIEFSDGTVWSWATMPRL
jgi:Ca2+-binding RTX toxin-like protein